MEDRKRRIADCLKGQAHICERIASLCWNEDEAIEFERLAHECNEAAADRPKQATWPPTPTFWTEKK